MLRYALYARKSKEDKSGVIKSIKDQKDIWYELAKERGLHIAAEFEENKSAKDPGVRPIYHEMVSRIRAGEIDGILVWHINRLGRNMAEAGDLAQLLIDGVVKEIRTPNWTYRPGDNILPLLLEQGMSTQYSRDLSEAVKRGTKSMVEDGGWPHQAKLGYKNARDPENPKKGIIIRDPERWDLTKRGFELMLTGGYSVRQAITAMNSWGLQTRPTPNRPGGKLSFALGYDIFTNLFYAGFTKHNGEVRRGKHEAMISLSDFNRLQGLIRKRGDLPEKRPQFAYTGMMRCGYCGMMITAERHLKKGVEYVYYRCTDPRNQCTKRGINEIDLDVALLKRLDAITIDPHLCEIALEGIARWQSGESTSSEEHLKEHQARLQMVETQRNNLLTMMLTGALTDQEIYKEKEWELLRERNTIELEMHKSLEDMERIREQARAGFNYVKLARDNFMMADLQKRKEIARALGITYVLREREVTAELDPLLAQIVNYVDQIMVSIEPAIAGSETWYRADFSKKLRIGRETRSFIEPPLSLIAALRAGLFPVLTLTETVFA